MGERVHKSILNAEVNLFFYFLSLFLAFFSRRIFLHHLGDEFIGLTGTLGNILGYLNLAELGIGTSVSYFLYKPLQQDKQEAINDYLSLFGYLYKVIGTTIFIIAIAISLFFPIFFRSEQISLSLIFFSFYSILGSSLIGYFINYRQILLSADQKNYVVTIYTQTAGIIKTIIQIFLAYKFNNPYVWVAIEFIFGILACIILNWKINQEYPWLKCNKNYGKTVLKKHPEILTKAKQVFIHKIKFFVLGKSDELFIFALVSLKMVAYYNNYMMIIGKVTTIFIMTINNIGAGIGNLIAEGKHANIMKVFWELSAIRYFISGFVCFSLYFFIESFITLWLGKEYLLPQSTLILLLIYFYINISHGGIDSFIYGMGLYADTWSAWAELVINLSITFTAGYYIGINGILLGKVISTFLIAVFWKPYYLFTAGLKEPYSLYWSKTIKYQLIFFISFGFVFYIMGDYTTNNATSYYYWIISCLITLCLYLSINLPLYIFFAPGGKDLLRRFKHKNKIH